MENFKEKLLNRAHNYALNIIKLINSLNKNDITVLTILKQLLRSGLSVGANIVEAQAASSRRDFANFLNHALKSANESIFWLGLLNESKNADQFLCEKLIKETKELASILAASILTIKEKKYY
jgi:four helix bundle protein